VSTPLHAQPPSQSPRPRPLSPATRARILAGLEHRHHPQEQARLTERTFALLTRGAGVGQIIKQVAQPNDSVVERLRVALLLRSWFAYYLNSGHAPDGVKNTLHDLTRTLAYIDRKIDEIMETIPFFSIVRDTVAPMATDEFGAQVDVRDGIPSFTLVGYPDGLQALLARLLRNRLAADWPRRRVTVNVPDGWAPHDEAVSALVGAIRRAARR
jgi:hypothetical protein